MLKMLIRKAKTQIGVEELIEKQPLKDCVLELIPIDVDYDDVEISRYCLVCFNKKTEQITHCLYEVHAEYHLKDGRYQVVHEEIYFIKED